MAARVAVAAARKQYARLLKRVEQGERVKITRYDRTMAVLIPKRDFETLEVCEEARPARPRRRAARRR
jgi:prevent-host-death family protein